MHLSPQDAMGIAALARLTIDEAHAAHVAEQMAKILDYMDTLNQVDTSATEPLYSPLEHVTVLRDDEVCATFRREDLLAGAPHTDGIYFLVPKVIG
jgi:aspartyl-tRNA(Asn)/glutamyl-tRNA(Gln) amidotransferase subunit C